MKNIILSFIIFVTTYFVAPAQYVIDFSNPATYQVTCGSVTPSQWSVKSSTCELSLPAFVLASVSDFTINYTFKINQSGNLNSNDILSIYYKKGIQSAWTLDTALLGNANNNVRSFSRSINIASSDTLYFKVVAHGVSPNGFWAVKSGDINIGNVRPIYFPLPIELADFKGYNEAADGVNHLSWTTLSELNNSHFIIEKSSDGFNYAAVSSVQGAGTSNMPIVYELIDRSVSADYYYRLTQFDYDGKFEVFNPIFVKASADNSKTNLMDNAWFDGANFQIITASGFEGSLNIELLSLDGRIIAGQSVQADPYGTQTSIDGLGISGQIVLLRVSDAAGNQELKKIATP